MTPATLATIKHSFPAEERPRAIAVWTASFGIGAAAGPVVAGALLERGGLPAVLLANLPLASGCAFGTWLLVARDLPRRVQPLDWAGAALCLLSAACLLFALLTGPTRGWLVPEVLFAVVAGGLVAASAVACLRRAKHPILDPALFAQAAFVRALLVILLGYFAFSGVSFVILQYLQFAREETAFGADLLNLPLPVSLLLGTFLAPLLMKRHGAERALLFSLCLALLGAVLVAAATRWQGELFLCLALVPFGGGCGQAQRRHCIWAAQSQADDPHRALVASSFVPR
jgi:Na+/melibiose symporter-like transporter